MAATAELSKEEQELFDQMSKEEDAPPVKSEAKEPDEDAKKAEADKAGKEAADKAAAAKKEQEKGQSGDAGKALNEARAENRLLHKELEQLKTTLADGDKKLQKFMDSVTKKAEQDQGPKFEDDPAGALKHENNQLRQQVTDINAKLAKQDEATDNQTKMQQFTTFITNREREFAKNEPNYFKAADYVAEIWRDEFREAGFEEEKIPQMVFGKSLAVTHQATQAKKDPAEAIWKIAKRYGFAAKPAETKAEDKKEEGGTKLEQIKRGVEAAKTTSGGEGPEDMSLASLAQMDDEQIDKLVSDKDWWSKNIRRSPLH